MVKKTVSILLALVCAASLTACGGAKDTAAVADTQTEAAEAPEEEKPADETNAEAKEEAGEDDFRIG